MIYWLVIYFNQYKYKKYKIQNLSFKSTSTKKSIALTIRFPITKIQIPLRIKILNILRFLSTIIITIIITSSTDITPSNAIVTQPSPLYFTPKCLSTLLTILIIHIRKTLLLLLLSRT